MPALSGLPAWQAGVAWAILWKHGLPTTDGRAGMSANRVNIRLARVEDAEMIGAFVRRLTREHVARDFPPQGRRFLQRALGTPRILEGMRGTCRYFVAEERGKMLGVVATRDDHHLLMLFVAEEAQGQGLARALWACCCCWSSSATRSSSMFVAPFCWLTR
ncbi:GNAT family N-acetyltransferase [Pseudomonas aeruginosa]|uniref:GNAT family N-acetyltransferase n=1 Tax=Pseudomonas aeruginosa TaxID=287 RepID=UPI003211E8E9